MILSIRFHLVFCFCFAFSYAQAEVPQPIKIGFILPLSGEWAHLGAGIRNGASLAAEELSPETPAQLFFEDNKGELAVSATAATRLIEESHVDALVSIISGVAHVIRPIASKAGILSIGICSDTSAADGQTAFINYLTAQQGVDAYLKHWSTLASAPKKLYLYSMNEAGFAQIAQTLRKNLTSLSIVGDETFNKGERDFRPALLKIKSTHPDAILLLGLSPEIELFAEQRAQLHIPVTLTSIESFGLSTRPSSFEGSWFIDSASPSRAFHSRYEAKFKTPVSVGVGHSYDTVQMLAKTFSQPNWREAFRKIRAYRGELGPLSVEPSGVILSEPSVKQIRNGHVVEVSHD